MYRIAVIGLILVAITTSVYFKISGLENQIKELKVSLETKTTSLANVTAGYKMLVNENTSLNETVAKNNSTIDNMSIDYASRIAKYKEELAKPPKVVIKKVYKTIYKSIGHEVDFEKASCAEGKSIMHAISESLKLEDI